MSVSAKGCEKHADKKERRASVGACQNSNFMKVLGHCPAAGVSSGKWLRDGVKALHADEATGV